MNILYKIIKKSAEMNSWNKMPRKDYRDSLSWEYIWICVDEKGMKYMLSEWEEHTSEAIQTRHHNMYFKHLAKWRMCDRN